MPGENIDVALPSIESGQVYAPASLAWRVENLQLTQEGTLRSVRGPAPFIPDYGAGYPYGGRVFSVFHARLDDGARDVTLIRAGGTLYSQAGWNRNLRSLVSGLSTDPAAKYPDTVVEVGGKIVWSNGIDIPYIYDGYTIKPLGFPQNPSTFDVLSPGQKTTNHPVFRNSVGYAHPGNLGSAGDFFSAQEGNLLAGQWLYFVQFEDVFGDRSGLSPAGSAVLNQELTSALYWSDYSKYPEVGGILGAFTYTKDLGLLSVKLDDLTKQFCVNGLPRGPRGTVARILYRTAMNESEPRFLARIPDVQTDVWPDNLPDSQLGAPAKAYITVPRFLIACSYQGRLAILDGNRVRLSEPGFPGSFEEDLYVDIDADGTQPTGLVAFGNYLYAFTEQSIFRIEFDAEGLRKRPVVGGVGAVGPKTIVACDNGLLVWLGRQNWYAMSADESLKQIADDEAPLFKRLNPAALSRAVATWSPVTKEYLCAVPEAGSFGNRLIMAWDGRGWRRQRLGIEVSYFAATKDWRNYIFAGGRLANGSENNVWVLDHEVLGYTPPTKTYRYQSSWIRRDPIGRLRFNVDTIYVGVVEASNRPVTWSVWRDGSRDTLIATGTLSLIDPATTDLINTVVIGTGKYRNPRLTWYKFDVRMKDLKSFAFDISCEEPRFLHLAGFAFDSHVVDEAGARVFRANG
jgi:hypothetical protein